MKQLNLSLESEIHLLYPIEEFVREKEKDTMWVFKVRPNGDKLWMNNYDKIISYQYPYIQELERKIDDYREKFNIETLKGNVKKDGIIEQILIDPRKGMHMLEKCKRKVLRVKFYIFKMIFKGV